METEKIDFQVFSWKCLDFEESPTSTDKSVFVLQHQGEWKSAQETQRKQARPCTLDPMENFES